MTPTSPATNLLLATQEIAQAEEILHALDDAEFNITWVQNDEAAINALNQSTFQALIAQVEAPRINGLRLMDAAQSRSQDTVTILLATKEQMEAAATALQNGALDFQLPPLNTDRLVTILRHGLAMQDLQFEAQRLRRRLDTRYGLNNIVGQSRAIELAYEKIRQTAPTDTPIILAGEPGTGKDHLAQTIHYTSARSNGPMVKWLCDDDTAANAEADLFGLPPDTSGLVAAADQGTLYLDSLRNIPGTVTEKLIAFQSLHTFERPGDATPHRSDARLIVSFNPADDLGGAAEKLLDELQRRFHAITIELPPLRDRSEDIPPLAEHFLGQYARADGKTGLSLTPGALDILNRHDWPGNLRELSATIHNMVIATRDDTPLTAQHIPNTVAARIGPVDSHLPIPADATIRDAERIIIQAAMERHSNNKEACAKALGIGLRTLYRKLKEYESD